MSNFDLPPEDEPENQPPSRTAVKREMEALQKLGTEIVELSNKYIARIPLEGKLEEAILQARTMKHREGRRRQLQYIGKLMRQAENLDAIREAYEKVLAIGQEHNKFLHLTEKWRDRLITEEGEALQSFIDEYPQAEIQYLRQLIRNAQKESKQNKPPASARKLFRYLRELIEA